MEFNNVEAVAQLVKSGANIIQRNSDNKTPLDIAFAKYQATADATMLNALLVNINSHNISQPIYNDETLMISAMRSKNEALANYLVGYKSQKASS